MFSIFKTENELLQKIPHNKQASLQFPQHFDDFLDAGEFDHKQFLQLISEKYNSATNLRSAPP